jgi:hypothetical protein
VIRGFTLGTTVLTRSRPVAVLAMRCQTYSMRIDLCGTFFREDSASGKKLLYPQQLVCSGEVRNRKVDTKQELEA